MKKFFVLATIIMLTISACGSPPPTAVPPTVVPPTVVPPTAVPPTVTPIPTASAVIFGDGTKTLGLYAQTGADIWEERGLDGALFTFKVTSSDENSITLFDESRGATIKLDLKNKVVNYEDSTQKIESLYYIVEVK